MKTNVILFLLISQSVLSIQHSDFLDSYDSIFYNLKTLKFKKNEITIDNLTDNRYKNLFIALNFLLSDNGETQFSKLPNKIIVTDNYNTKDNFNRSLADIINGYKYLYYKDRVDSYKHFYSALILAKKTQYPPLIKLAFRSMLNFYRKGKLQNDDTFKIYLNDYYNYCNDPSDFMIYHSFKLNLLAQTNLYDEKNQPLKKVFKNIFVNYDSVSTKIENGLKTIYYIDKGNFLIRDNAIKAKEFYDKAWKNFTNDKFYNKYKLQIKWNLSRVYSLLNKHKNGLKEIYSSYCYISPNDSLISLFANYHYSADHHAKLKNYDSAYYYMRKSIRYNYLMNFQKHNTEISKIREELQIEKKEKENIQLKADKTQNRNLFIATLISLIAGAIISLLFLNNSEKKRQLAEQEKALEKQKNINLLKEQEISAINAMIDGQEKERKRIAEDLHDNIGSVLATLKLHFENLKLNRKKKKFNQEELYKKTENLIDETYLKVRRIAHAKNAGVIANQGLLVAVKIMAEKISSADKINIEVIDYGLDSRLENSLEITVFRIIQELTTNIVKHANAQNATINISQYDTTLNIIVEDDGKGFDYKNIKIKDGIGLSSIKTRIAHLNGTFNVDSSLGNGTSIIMDIPIV